MTVLEIPADDYHADKVADVPSLSRSIAHILCTRTPLHAWHAHPKLNPDWQPVEDAKFDVGTAAHALLFHGEPRVEVIPAKDWRTAEARIARDAARAAGKVPMLPEQWEETQAMVASAEVQLAGLEVDPAPFTDGKPEQTLVWEEAGGVVCRARLDWLRDDLSAIDDYKTTTKSASPEVFTRTLFSMGYDVQAAFYLRGMQAIDEVAYDREFRFAVQETFPPYLLSVVSLGPAAMVIAERKVDLAIRVWSECLRTNEWPGYPARVAYAELPAWEEARWLERELTEAA